MDAKKPVKEIKQMNKKQLVLMLIYALLFYIVSYWMIPIEHKMLYVVGMCLGGFFIPFIPFALADNGVNKFICRTVLGILLIPILLGAVFLYKFAKVAQHNYVLPSADKILFSVSYDWEELENDNIGNDWKHRVNVECEPDDEGHYHFASLNTDIKVTAFVTEKDEYDNDDEEDEEEYRFDSDDTSYNTVIFPATLNFGKQQTATVDLTVLPDHGKRVDRYTNEKGQARWRCKITVKRKLQFWEVLLGDLDYSHVDYTAPYQLGKVDPEPGAYENGSVQKFSSLREELSHYLDYDFVQLPSSAIYEAAYSSYEECLLIRFKHDTGPLYVFYDVPEDVFEELCYAEQPGSYFNTDIKNQYDYDLLWE